MKSGAKGKKIGRNKKWCEVYASIGRRLVNKRKKIARHLRSHPGDVQARKAI